LDGLGREKLNNNWPVKQYSTQFTSGFHISSYTRIKSDNKIIRVNLNKSGLHPNEYRPDFTISDR